MWHWLDKVLLEPVAVTEHLQRTHTARVWFQLLLLATAGYALFGMSSAALYGGYHFALSSVLFPAIFLGALLLSIPALYIFSSFLGSQMQPKQTIALGLIALVVPALVLAGMAPIHWFVAVSTGSSRIMHTGNLAACLLAGLLGFLEIRKVWGKLEPHRMAQPEQSLSQTHVPSPLSVSGATLVEKYNDIREQEVVSLDEMAKEESITEDEASSDSGENSVADSSQMELSQDEDLSVGLTEHEPCDAPSHDESIERSTEHRSSTDKVVDSSDDSVAARESDSSSDVDSPVMYGTLYKSSFEKIRSTVPPNNHDNSGKTDSSNNVQDQLLSVWLVCYLGILLKLMHSFGPMMGWK